MIRIAIIVLLIVTSQTLMSQDCDSLFGKYLEVDSRLISCTGNLSIEKTRDKNYIVKRYMLETGVITELSTYSDRRLRVRQGPYVRRWDDGTIVDKGEFKNNMKEGPWIIDTYQTGLFKDGMREGLWQTRNEDSIIVNKAMYENDVLNGPRILYDSTGNKIVEELYANGELLHTSQDTMDISTETMPLFPGCEDFEGDHQELLSCSESKLLEYLTSNIEYPKKALENGVEGVAVIQFVIDKYGTITEIKALSGVSTEIKEQSMKLIESMPNWAPGTQNGEPVRVIMKLPIRYRLGY